VDSLYQSTITQVPKRSRWCNISRRLYHLTFWFYEEIQT